MNVITHARQQVISGAPVTQAVRATQSQAPPWQALATVLAELQGAGRVIQPLLDDPEVTDVLINGDEHVWIDSGRGLRRLALSVDARHLALRLATLAGQRLDNAAPIVDGRLPDGTRLHAVLPPLVHGSAHISLRRQTSHHVGWEQLQHSGFLTQEFAQVISELVKCRANVVVSGAGGAGKTTLVAAVLAQVPTWERIVIIEEASELMPDHPHVVHLQARTANVQGTGQVSLAQLVRAAMRMRADRLVVGECRGEEVREMLAGFNTGHDGGWATIHANTAQDVPARLIALGALANMEPRTVEVQTQAGIDAVIHVQRSGQHRQVGHIGVVSKSGDLQVRPALMR
ncbi:MAG TPA: TadA family conjugal transfer-associated ATPase, partial [Beutenbergiaceae bacterium]|nr:TadA family conjugal transfer-associated ATPase [Beutenbergiaceae bacterium]